MSYAIVTDKDDVDIHVTLSDTITPNELIDYFEEAMEIFDNFDGKTTLIIVGRVSVSGLSFRSMSEFADMTKTFGSRLQGSRTAVVTPGDLGYGLMRMYLSLRNPDYEMDVFRSEVDALSWLQRLSDR